MTPNVKYVKKIEGVVNMWMPGSSFDKISAVNVQFYDSDRLHNCFFNSRPDAVKFMDLLHIEVLAHIVTGKVLIHDNIIRKVREDNNLWWRPF